MKRLDTQRGSYLSSGYEYPERYSRIWDVASIAPPLEIIAADREITLRPLNARGEVINRLLEPVLRPHPHWDSFELLNGVIQGHLKPLPALFPEEERSKQPSAFSLLRALLAEFHGPLPPWRSTHCQLVRWDLICYSASIRFSLKHPRSGVKDTQLFLCDDIYFMDRKKEHIERYGFDFTRGEDTTRGLPHAAQRVKTDEEETCSGPGA